MIGARIVDTCSKSQRRCPSQQQRMKLSYMECGKQMNRQRNSGGFRHTKKRTALATWYGWMALKTANSLTFDFLRRQAIQAVLTQRLFAGTLSVLAPFPLPAARESCDVSRIGDAESSMITNCEWYVSKQPKARNGAF